MTLELSAVLGFAFGLLAAACAFFISYHEYKNNWNFRGNAVAMALRSALVAFVFFFTAAIVSSGMQISRVVAWSCIVVGDVTWFVIIFAASMSIASVLSDNRIIFIFTLVVGFGLPVLIRRIAQRRQSPVPWPR